MNFRLATIDDPDTEITKVKRYLTGAVAVPIDPPDNAIYYICWPGETSGEDSKLVVNDDGYALIPDEVFQTVGRIYIICREEATGSGKEVYRKRYDVLPADKPSGYMGSTTYGYATLDSVVLA